MRLEPYDVLGLSSAATAAEIKQAYRKLARAHHPDLHPNDAKAETTFKDISAAYDLLKDAATRARFDAGEIDSLGAEKPPRQYYRDFSDATGNAYRPQPGYRAGFASGDPGDIFAEMLRQRGEDGQGFAAPGRDLRFTLNVPFLDAARGAEMRVTLGDGGDVAVRIPPGAEDGQVLRLRGMGRASQRGGVSGDALITLSLQANPVFRRDGADILITLPISIDEAILGAKVRAPTISGPVSLTIPAGTSSGRVLRLRGRGMAKAIGSEKGDQRVELRIVAPPKIDAALSDFMTNWRRTHSHDPRTTTLSGAT
ncbi:DnaJ C-terminal domain-containing protein [Pseudorhodobacter sp. MZDSW-24AT]|uniref:DnaJ C-terminal domain-containing protein n=1 Tax=Pseudorhodobacter sp. MZDSW-24AT TaxID=2052957 RepID=UPI000C1E9D1C|nr:DnaJ C-terminal domain-containing protein [Pseudorhodobacter sp. MZDSW-24AT]PJF08859.1 molecular chaperone DnaJ [Pseudorhodobacter sp. MZDSW-24AT]